MAEENTTKFFAINRIILPERQEAYSVIELATKMQIVISPTDETYNKKQLNILINNFKHELYRIVDELRDAEKK